MRRYWTDDEVRIIEATPGNAEASAALRAAGYERSIHAVSVKRSNITRMDAVSVDPEPEAVDAPDLPERDGMDISEYYRLVKELTAEKLRRLEVERQKIVPVDLPAEWTGICFVGDIHIGGTILYDQLESDLDLIESTPGLRAVGMGDYAEMFGSQPKLLKAMAETVVPGSDDQMDIVHHVMGRCSKWDAILLGNHDGWAGQRGVKVLAERLRAAYVSEAGCSIKYQVGDQRYTVYAKHQYQGHSNLNTSNESRRFWNEFADFDNADVTVLAHYHQPDTHVKELKGQSVTHARGGTYKIYDEYSFKGGYTPAYGPSMVIFSPVTHEVIPFHGPQWRHGVEYLGHLRNA